MGSKIAVAGAGRWGRNLVRNFHELGALGAVCDPSTERTDEVRAKYSGVATHAAFDRVLQDASIEGVVIATPAPTHRDLVKASLLAGKHVMVEKPLCLSAARGERLVQLAAQQNRILMVGHVLEYHPGILKLRELVDEGVLGDIRYIYSNRLNLGTIRTEENILWSFAPHDVAVILRLVGAMPFQVVSCGGTYLQPNVADMTVTHLLFDNGVRAHIHISWLHPFKEQRLVVVGSRRMASFDDVGKELTLFDRRGELEDGQPVTRKGDGETVPYGDGEPLREECQAFLNAMERGEPPLTHGESGVRVLRVLEASQHSLVMNGQPVALPVDHFSA